MSRVYATSMLERKITKLSQELKSLKTPQRYLTNQVLGYETNVVRVDSHIAYQAGGYTNWVIWSSFKFTGTHLNKVCIPKLKYQLYSASGQKIEPDWAGTEYYDVVLPPERVGETPGDAPNEYLFMMYFSLVTESTASSNFYGHFWCVANDTGTLIESKQYADNR